MGLFRMSSVLRFRSATALVALLSAMPASAQEVLPEVVVSASRLETAPERVGSAVTVISGADVERMGRPDVFGALQGVPGVALTRNGGIGTTAYARVRGAEPGQTQVLIDGVLVNDPASIDNAFNFDALAVTALDRIEVLRGPQSALYGNDAMGGVISIVTKRGKGAPTVTGLAEAGSYATHRQAVGVSGGTDRVGYALSGTNLYTGGYSRLANTAEKDKARGRGVTGKADVDVTENWTVGVAGGLFDLRSDYDASSRDAPYRLEKTLRYGKLDNSVTLFGGRMENVVSLSATSTDRSFDEPRTATPHTNYEGTRVSGEYRANIHVDADDVLTVGAARVRESARITTDNGRRTTLGTDASLTTDSVYGQYVLGLWDRLTVTLGGRHDHNDRFGGKSTVRATASYRLKESGTTLRASIGTAGKAPTLFNLYAPIYGNPSLRPESSTGADVGVEQAFLDRRLTVSVTAFHNRFSDLITFESATNTYANVDRARAQGLEAGATWQAGQDLKVTATYTFTDSRNETTGRALPRRPKHQGSLGAVWQATEAAQVGGQVRFVGPQADSTFNNAINAAYTVVDAQAGYALTEAVTLYGRVENLFNADYQEVARYATPGRSGYVGVKAKF